MTNEHFVNIMPLSNSVLRRYTPPTCTLEVVAKSSPLSRWVGQSLMKDLRFELRFDDPRQPEEERVTIRGNAGELDILCEAVNSYVQDFLNLSSTQLPRSLGTPATAANSTPDESSNRNSTTNPASFVNFSTLGTAQGFEEARGRLDASSLDTPDHNVRSFKPRSVPRDIYLQPKGLLTHELFLGQLATEESGPVLPLSATQLFDLATALDEYAAEVVVLPKLNKSFSLKQVPPAWTSAAAVLLAVGVTAAGVKYFDQPNKQQIATSKVSQQPSPGQRPLASQVPPAPISPLPISPLPTPAVPPALASSPKLAPPSAVPLPPPIGSLPPSQTGNSASGTQRSLSVNPSAGTSANSSNRSGSLSVSGGTAPLPPPLVSGKGTSSGIVSGQSTSSGSAPTQSSIPGGLTAPPLPSFPSLKPNPTPANATAQAEPPSNTRSGGSSVDLNEAESAQAPNPANSRLFDSTPQVAEVRSYFEQQWKPPSGLTQKLEYTLWLSADGSIQRIDPLGNAAIEYLERKDIPVAIPLPGTPFVSPLGGKNNSPIRVVLYPEGKVEVLPDNRQQPGSAEVKP